MERTKSYLFLTIPNLPALLSRQKFPATEGRPLVVVTDKESRGVVLSASPEARALGVRAGLLVRDLAPWMPRVDLIPEEPSHRKSTVQALSRLLQEYTPDVRPVGEASFLLDLTGTERLWGGGEQVARQLVDKLSSEWRLQAVAGVGPTRTTARIAARVTQAPGVKTVTTNEIEDFLQPLSVDVLPGVGSKLRQRLHRYGIRTIGELAEVSPSLLVETFGAYRGILLERLAQGQDVERLEVKKEISSFSRSMDLPEDTVDPARIEASVAYLCGRLSVDLTRRKMVARRLSVMIRYTDGLERRMNLTLPSPAYAEAELVKSARNLLEKMLPMRRSRISHVGLQVARLRPTAREDTLFDLNGYRKQEMLAEELNQVRRRHGYKAVLSGRAQAAVA
jgi:DNA polymerase IV